jgi:hypothetical protein
MRPAGWRWDNVYIIYTACFKKVYLLNNASGKTQQDRRDPGKADGAKSKSAWFAGGIPSVVFRYNLVISTSGRYLFID